MPSQRPGKGTAGEPMSRARSHLRPDRGPRAWAKIQAVYRLSGMSAGLFPGRGDGLIALVSTTLRERVFTACPERGLPPAAADDNKTINRS